jgi:peptide/nickel transport system substrate-binding protein
MTRNEIRTVLCGLLVLGLWGCSPDSGCEGDGCGTVVVVTTAEADVLLPPATHTDVGVGLTDLIFAKLADLGPDLNTVGDAGFIPVLASEWSFEDSLAISFTLHPDARWHDGHPVTALDVAFTFDVYSDTLVNAPARRRLAHVTSVTAQDLKTVVFRFDKSYAEQFFDAVYHMRILPEHILGQVPRAGLATHGFGRQPIGAGPYRFVRWQTGELVELVADSEFFLGRPGIQRVVWRFTADPNTALTQLVAGDADVMNSLGGPPNIERVAKAEHLRPVPYPVPVYMFVGFNMQDAKNPDLPHPLFSNVQLRRAMSMAVDRRTLVRGLMGEYGNVPVGPVTRPLWIWDENIRQLPFDSAGARRLLAELGWRDSDGDGTLDRNGQSFAFDLLVPSSSGLRRQAAIVLQDQLKRVGITMRITELEFNTFFARAAAGRFDAHFGAWGQDPSPASIEDIWTTAGIGNQNFGRYSNPEVDRLVRSAVGAADMKEARRLWHEAISVMNADAPAIWLVEPVAVAGVHERFEDVSIRTDQWAADLWMWTVARGRMIERDLLARR